MPKTAIFKDDLFLEHRPGPGHPESPERLTGIYQVLREPALRERFLFPSFPPAGRELLALNHTPAHIDRVAATAGKPMAVLDPDTTTSPRSYEAACLAAGACVEGVRLLLAGEIDNGFALVRPPGHHAEATHTSGFCLFNNIAIAARYALARHGLSRVLIADWDLHHGNGTQHAFEETDQVLYFSTHQYPYFPGTGSFLETGAGQGEGYTVNVPLHGGQGDGDYARLFRELLAPIARQYRPELILASAGFDIFGGDPLGTMRVTPAGFAYMTRVLRELAAELCGGRLLLVLEGGYHLQGLTASALAVLAELSGAGGLDAAAARELAAASAPLPALNQAREVQKNYWTL
ncbi:MAG: histone deacetylase [Desulfobacteraceae bacterium]|nr:histone deacetylase [Desulfobacteraceae bacterium]